MKTLLIAIGLFMSIAYSAFAQQNYKHPYGLQREKKTQVHSQKTILSADEKSAANRNYKNPQKDRADREIVLLPGNRVETVTNPLTAANNYKLQNRRKVKEAAKSKEDEGIFAEDK